MMASFEGDPGLWMEPPTAAVPPGRPALFLDRDGVLVEETHYLSRVADVRLIEGAAGGISCCNARGIPVVIVTNQAGIGRGYYGWAEFRAVQAEIVERLARDGARIDCVLACAYHEHGEPPFRVAGHVWRKPNPGMIEVAARTLGTDLAGSLVVGDRLSDLEAGLAAGVGHGTLVRTGYGREEAARLGQLAGRGMRVGFAEDAGAAIATALADLWA